MQVKEARDVERTATKIGLGLSHLVSGCRRYHWGANFQCCGFSAVTGGHPRSHY